jgi:hypothetical protein
LRYALRVVREGGICRFFGSGTAARAKGVAVIRQAISCDICGAEKKQTNHWFVAYEQAGELRVSGWISRNRLKADAKHLCGQACLHKLADDFMARVIGEKAAARSQPAAEAVEPPPAPVAEQRASTNAQSRSAARSPAAVEELEAESSARLIAPAEGAIRPIEPRQPARPAAGVLPMPDRAAAGHVPLPAEPPRYASRHWRAEAWERERERSLRSADCRPEHAARRFSQA